MVSFVNGEYLKIAGYVVSGFLAARAWFAKEIKAGQVLLAHVEAAVKAKAQQIEADVKKVETAVKADVTAVENKL